MYLNGNQTPATHIVGRHYKWPFCGEQKDTYFSETYKTMKPDENKIVYYKETVECWQYLDQKSEEGPLPYCKTTAESKENNQLYSSDPDSGMLLTSCTLNSTVFSLSFPRPISYPIYTSNTAQLSPLPSTELINLYVVPKKFKCGNVCFG
jgi:hypothetical protein